MASVPKTSPLAPARFPDLPVIEGVRFATAAAGVKYADREDVALMMVDGNAVLAGVFTQSKTRAASILDCQAKIGSADSGPLAILVNSGNANAFTGSSGLASVERICEAVSGVTEVAQSRVFTNSTGVIGEKLPDDKITAKLKDLVTGLDAGNIDAAARAIMTTDTFAKGASATVEVDGKPVNIAGIAKGSGMIAPDMATMLVFVFTDAVIKQQELQALLARLTETTFNAITVDSDTSTSDSLLCAATGASGSDVTGNTAFETALTDVMRDLAHQVVRDGEGATKFVEVRVTGARNVADAKTHAMAIANSPLVKTAIAGEDPNWGRIVMAVGKSGAEADRDTLSIWFGDVQVAKNGWVSPDYTEEAGAAHMTNEQIKITVDLGIGSGDFTAWTCDLTHGYIEINADYRS